MARTALQPIVPSSSAENFTGNVLRIEPDSQVEGSNLQAFRSCNPLGGFCPSLIFQVSPCMIRRQTR